MRRVSGIMGILSLALLNICRFLLSFGTVMLRICLLPDDGCFYGLPHLLAERVACFSDVCRDRSLGAFNLMKTELAMIDRSQVDPNHRLLFANALATEVDRGLFHMARLQLVSDDGNPPSSTRFCVEGIVNLLLYYII